MSRMGIAGIVGAVGVAALLAVPGAQAKGIQAHISLEGAHGYPISIDAGRGSSILVISTKRAVARATGSAAVARSAARDAVAATPRMSALRREAARRRPGVVSLSAVHQGAAASVYTVLARVTSRRIKADLGDFGRISLRFHPHASRSIAVGPHCDGRIHQRTGAFTGRIHFRGEHGYTSVRARRAKGWLRVSGRVHCHRAGGHHGHHDHGGRRHQETTLEAHSGQAYFAAFAQQQVRIMLTDTGETQGRVHIGRFGFGSVARSAFTFNKSLTSAHVEPAGIFSGSAHFTSPRSWTGTLTASFPGAADVPMAGPDFRAKLKRGRG